MSFWTDLEAAIAAELQKIKASVIAAAKDLKPVVVAGAEEVGTAAVQAVMAQAPALLSGQEKLSAAIASVKTTIAATGKSAATSVIEASVQEAYDQAAILAHPPTS